MKFRLLLISFLCTVFFSSCYKKLYFACQDDKKNIQNDNSLLTTQNETVKKQEAVVQKQNDDLTKEQKTLAAEIEQLQNEKNRLIKLEDDELEQVNKAIAAYFDRIAKLASAPNHLPPCPNAANGHFTNSMTGADIRALGNPQLTLTTKSANELLAAFKDFANGNQAAFINNPNHAPDGWVAVTLWTKDYIGKIGDFLFSLISAINSDGKDNKKNAQAAVSAAKLYQAINKNSNCHSGRHANGWVSHGVKGATQHSLNLLNSYTPSSAKGSKIKTVLANTFYELLKLPTEGHEHWLNADWQIRYFVIMDAASTALSSEN